MFDRREVLGSVLMGAAALAPATSVVTPAPATAADAGRGLDAFGAEAERLMRRTGLWDVVETVWTGPGGAPATTTGPVAERIMIGWMLQEVLRTSADDVHHAVPRMDMLTSNRLVGRWDYVSFDARAPVGLMPAWSTDTSQRDVIKLSVVSFAVPSLSSSTVGQLLLMEQTIRFRDDAHETKDQYFTLADGTGTRWLAHRYAYRRGAA